MSANWYARPVFFVSSCEETLPFYSRLGFSEAWRHEENGTLVAVQVARDGSEIILNQDPTRAGGGRLFVSLENGEVAKCAAEFESAGIEVRDDQWGMPVKSVTDPDGNDLLFFDDDLAH